MDIRLSVESSFIKKLQADLNNAPATEIVRAALSLFNWAVKETKEGRVILSSDQNGEHQLRLAMPILEQIKPIIKD